MGLLSSLGIAQRLWAVAVAVTVGLAAMAGLAWVKLDAVVAAARKTESTRVPQLSEAASMELNITRVSLQIRHAMLARSPAEQAAALADIAAKRKLIAEAATDYEKALFTDKGRALFARLPPVMEAFWREGEANIALVTAGRKEDAFAFLVDRTIPARNALLAVLDEMVLYQKASLTTDIEKIGAEIDAMLTILIGCVAASIAGLMLSSGHVARTLKRRVALTRKVAERVRDGDLSTPVDATAHDEFAPLLAAMAEMQTSLAGIVASVRGNAESVATASAEIAQGNQDLSMRTEQQAGALQQTAATMAQLGSTVQTNADSAKQASTLTVDASGVAVRGGQVVSQVIETMRGIDAASRKITDIISVIDGIAFQTNILALNAAVEAARAGEQGRGFAVVAGEVRTLAQRSAEAAREIKSLITDSVARVAQGTTLVGQAGQTMNDIVAAITRVNDIVGEITAASEAQNGDVAQVGQNVAQLDQATQQNAALVEESAAAAESLKAQASELVQAVAVFRLAEKA